MYKIYSKSRRKKNRNTKSVRKSEQVRLTNWMLIVVNSNQCECQIKWPNYIKWKASAIDEHKNRMFEDFQTQMSNNNNSNNDDCEWFYWLKNWENELTLTRGMFGNCTTLLRGKNINLHIFFSLLNRSNIWYYSYFIICVI